MQPRQAQTRYPQQVKLHSLAGQRQEAPRRSIVRIQAAEEIFLPLLREVIEDVRRRGVVKGG